jgi:hypothetical protein
MRYNHTRKLSDCLPKKDFLSRSQHPSVQISKPEHNVPLMSANVHHRIAQLIQRQT